MPGSRRSRTRCSGSLALFLAPLLALATLARGAEPEVVGDAMPRSLTGLPGDPARGRAIVGDRRLGLCLLCHQGPFPTPPLQGNLAPDLRGAGARLNEGQLRLRVADARRLNPATIMPSYGRIAGLAHVAPAWRGRPILSPGQIEDVVAYLATLREEEAP